LKPNVEFCRQKAGFKIRLAYLCLDQDIFKKSPYDAQNRQQGCCITLLKCTKMTKSISMIPLKKLIKVL